MTERKSRPRVEEHLVEKAARTKGGATRIKRAYRAAKKASRKAR